MGKIADIVMGDYSLSETNVFDLVDEKFIREENGEKILEITDELIDKLALSNIPNQQFLDRDMYSKDGEYLGKFSQYGEIISNHVLARRGYPKVKDVLFDIYNKVYFDYLGYEEKINWYNGIKELHEMIKNIPHDLIIKILRKKAELLFERDSNRYLLDRNDKLNFINRLREERISKKDFGEDKLWEQIEDYLRKKQKDAQNNIKKWKIDVPYYKFQSKIYEELLNYMELADVKR